MTSHLDYEINKELGECYLFMGELDKAEQYYEKAANSNGTHPDPYLGLATVAVQRGHLDNALSLYRRASEIEASDKSLAGMALVEMETGALDSAFTHFSQALEHNPENLVALYGLVQAGHGLNRLEAILSPWRTFWNSIRTRQKSGLLWPASWPNWARWPRLVNNWNEPWKATPHMIRPKNS